MKTTIPGRLDRMEGRAAGWMARHGVALLRVSKGGVFFLVRRAEVLPGPEPAEDLAARTIGVLTSGVAGPSLSLPVLAAWECAIGLCFVTGRLMRAGIALLFAQMAGTFLPLAFFPAEAWAHAPYAATLEGQYIIKNVVLVSAGLVLGAAARGYTLVRAGAPEPARLRLGLPVLMEDVAVLCAAPGSRCRTVLVDAAVLPPRVRAAFHQAERDRGARLNTGSTTPASGTRGT